MNKLINFFTHNDAKLRDNRWIFLSMLIGSLLSLWASFNLSVEAIALVKNPDAALTCSINAVLNCAAVGNHPTSYLFGFPNSFIGMMAEPIVITVAIAGLMGIAFPRRFMFLAQIGYTLGLIFALALFYISFNIIQVLCPWCLLVTVTTILVWFAITRYNIRENNLYLPKNLQKKLHGWIEKDYDKLLMWGSIALLVALILFKYGNGIFLS